MTSIQSFSDMTQKDVFTDKGLYCGKVTDMGIDLDKFRVRTVIVDTIRGSLLSNIVGNKKGVVIPFSIVQSIGDIIIIKHISPSSIETEPEKAEEEQTNMKRL